MAVDGEVARGRRRLSDRLFPALLAGDLGSWLLLHVEGVTVEQFPCTLPDKVCLGMGNGDERR
jgi:hypothetical protein